MLPVSFGVRSVGGSSIWSSVSGESTESVCLFLFDLGVPQVSDSPTLFFILLTTEEASHGVDINCVFVETSLR